MYLVPYLLYLATLTLAFSIPPRPLSGHFASRPAHAHARLRPRTASLTSSSATALPSSPPGSEIPNVVEQSNSSTSSVPSSSTVSSSSTLPPSTPLPSTPVPSPVSQQTQQDMDTVLQRRLGFITTSATGVSQIASWYVTHPVSLLIHI